MADLKIFLFGTPIIEYQHQPVKLGRRKALAVLAYIVSNRRVVSRDTLATLLWPEYDQARARATLRNTLYAINQELPGDWLVVERETVSLNLASPLWVDVEQFQAHLAAYLLHGHLDDEVCTACLEPLTEATLLYRDHFLAGFTLRDSPEFDDWQHSQSEQLRQSLAQVLKKLVLAHSALEEFERAMAYAQRWLRLDPYNEEAHRHLMMLYAWAGQRDAALRQYQACVEVLEVELAVAPLDETVALYNDLKANQIPARPIIYYPQLEAVALAEQTTALADAARLPIPNLPPQPTPFLGRKTELVQLAGMLQDPACHLLTLVGLGGSGKTRLALQIAAQEMGRYTQGVYFVALAQISEVKSIVPAIAETLEFSLRGKNDPETQLLEYLSNKQLLLVLDNFEHLVDAGALLQKMLDQAPGVKLLVTSRERLNLPGEWLFEVSGMDLPPENGAGNGHSRDVGTLENYGAVRLFLESGRRAWYGFSLTDGNVPFVLQTCRLVEGIPLAIELAASWLRVLSCEEIAHEIEQDIDLLSSTMRGIPERHRSLRATFEHSWRMLSDEERLAFCKMTVFQGGFRREAVQQVVGMDLPILAALVDKSLLRRSAVGRYEIHELLRQYAFEKLTALPDVLLEVRRKHAGYFAGFVQTREAALGGTGQVEVARDIRKEIDNIRTAWQWIVQQRQFDVAEQTAAPLYAFYYLQAWYREGKEAFASLIDALPTDAAAPMEIRRLRAKCLSYLASILAVLVEVDAAHDCAQQSLALWKNLAPESEMALAICTLGRVAQHLRNKEEATRHFQSSLRYYEQAGDRAGIAHTIYLMGILAERWGEYKEAHRLFRQSLDLYRALEHVEGISVNLNMLGEVDFRMADYKAARAYAEEALQLARDLNDSFNIFNALNTLANIEAIGMGNREAAKQLYDEVLAQTRRSGTSLTLARVLNNVGMFSQMLGQYAEARALLGESVDLYKRIHYLIEVGAPLINLGLVEDALGDHKAAQDYYAESIASYESINQPWGLAYALVSLGYSLCLSGDFEQARSAFHDGLETASDAELIQVSLNAVVGLARVFASRGDKTTALKHLLVVRQHPLTDAEVRERADPLYDELTASLDPQSMASIARQADALKFENIVSELLNR